MGRKRRTLLCAAALTGAPLLAAAAPERFRIELWVNGEGAAEQPGVLRFGPHPCGAIVEVRTSSMASYRRGGIIEPELVVERADGRERTRWSVPVNYQLLAVRGQEVLIDTYRNRLWISANGDMRRERNRGPWPEPQSAACPADTSHPDSAYAQCANFRDLESGAARFIEYESDCS